MASDAQSHKFQRETILNLHNSGISPQTIAFQLDMEEDTIISIIKENLKEEEKKRKYLKKVSEKPMLSSFYLNTVIDIDREVREAQSRLWTALKSEPEIDLCLEGTYSILEKLVGTKATLVILHIDLVESTRLSMTLPIDRLATIIKAFNQEMSKIIKYYGGYILKYIGDAIIGFFVVSNEFDLSVPCMNAVDCGKAMVRIIREGLNPILNQYDYPEMKVRIGIDMGENAIVQFGWDRIRYNNTKPNKVITIKRRHMDILGYTISIAAKMTSISLPDRITIGEIVYNLIPEGQKQEFEMIHLSSEIWNYVSEKSGSIYRIYMNK